MMKKIILIACLAAFSFVHAQFPGKDVGLFNGTEVRVKEKEESFRRFGYAGFYTTEVMGYKNVYAGNVKSEYNMLVGKVFKVLEVVPYEDRYRIKLENAETGILYYKYHPDYESDFPFEFVSGLKLPPDFYCKQLETYGEQVDGETRVASPYEDGISFVKIIEQNSGIVYLDVSIADTALTATGKGLSLTLENGKKFLKPNAEMDVEVNDDGSYRYSVFVRLTTEDIKVLAGSNIKDATIHTHSNPVQQGAKIREYIKCLMK